jgi:hypothetical protein
MISTMVTSMSSLQPGHNDALCARMPMSATGALLMFSAPTDQCMGSRGIWRCGTDHHPERVPDLGHGQRQQLGQVDWVQFHQLSPCDGGEMGCECEQRHS